MSDVVDYWWDIDNIHNVFLTEGQSVHINENIDQNGHRTFVVKFTFDTGVLTIKQTSHNEDLDHVFLLTFIKNEETTCLFWGLLEMEYQGLGKRFTVTSQEFSTEAGVNALRQILPDENISNDILASYPNEGNDEEVQDEEEEEEEEEENDPALNLGDRFADATDDASDDDAFHDDASDDDASDDDAFHDDASYDEELFQV